MSKGWRRLLLGLLAFSLAPALYAANPCATGGSPVMRDGSGSGGTGLRPAGSDGSGQGGTGISPDMARGGDGTGSGGTGHSVEVEGVITGFASLCVNGLELHYHPATPVTIHGRTASPADLEVGQVVRALARGQGDQLTVQQVHVRHLLIGQVQAMGPGALRAQGRTIQLSPGTVVPAGLAPGIKVAVSGFAGANGRSVATRLDVVPGDTPDSLTGEVLRTALGRLSVDGVVLDGRLPGVAPGDIVRAEGRYADGRMQVARIEREDRDARVDRVVVQGLVRNTDRTGLDVGGQRFLIDSRTRGKEALPRAGEWAIVDAVREGGQLRVRDLEEQAHPASRMSRPDHGENRSRRDDDRDESAPDPEQASHLERKPKDRDQEMTSLETRESGERHEPAEVPELPESVGRAEKPETIEKPDKVERPEVERPEKIERPEVERVERIEHEHDD